MITPTYNRAAVLPRAIESVLDQDHDDTEYIIVDGPSTDETEEVVYSFDSDTITYLRNDRKRGLQFARNRGIENASGEAICFLDSDDELPKDAISTLVTALETSDANCGGVYGHQRMIQEEGQSVMRYPGRIDLDTYLNCTHPGTLGGKLYPKAVFEEIGGFDTDYPAAADTDFHLRLLAHGYHLEGVDRVTFLRYFGEGQMSYDIETILEAEGVFVEKHRDILPAQKKAVRVARVGRRAADQGEMSVARRCFGQAIKYHPSRPLYYYYALTSVFGARSYRFGKRLKSGLKNRFA